MSTTKTGFKKLAIIAGGGAVPKVLIEACRQEKRPFFVLALKNQANPDLLPEGDNVFWVRLGAAGTMVHLLKKHKAEELVMIGSVRRPSLREVWPDLYGLQMACRIGLNKQGDDGLLRGVIQEIEKLGITVRGVHEFVPQLLAPMGAVSAKQPDVEDITDIARGCYVAKLLGLADVGQSVIVQRGLVLSVEGIEGTKALIERTKHLRRKGNGGVLVKMSKPEQEKRVDMPTIGVETVQSVFDAGLKGIAVEAGNVLIHDVEGVQKRADELNIFVVGVSSEALIAPAFKERLDILQGKSGKTARAQA